MGIYYKEKKEMRGNIVMMNQVKTCRWMSALLLAVVLFGLLPNTVYAVSGDSPQKTVRVGWFEDSYNITGENGERSGYGYEYQQSVAAYTGWEYEYVKAGWSDLLTMLQNGEIDLMSGVSYTDERAQNMLFSDLPMGEEKYYLYADVAHTDISASNLESLNGKRVGLLANSIHATQFYEWEAEHGLHLEYVTITGLEDAFAKVENDEIDCLVSTETPQLVEIGMSAIVRIGGSNIYFVVNKDRSDLKEELDSAMRKIAYDKPSYANELYQHYLAATSTAVLTNTEKEWLEEHGAIRIGWVKGDAGISELDTKSGEIVGVLSDYIRFASDCLDNQTLTFETVGFDSLEEEMQALRDGEIDMIFHFSQNPSVAEDNGFTLSNTVFSDNMAAATAQSYFDENAAHTVAVIKGDTLLEWTLSYNYPTWSIVEYDTLAKVEKAVRSGEADCMIADAKHLSRYIEDSKLYNVYLTKADNSSFAVHRGDTILVSILNKTLSTMSSSALTGALSMYQNSMREVTFMDFVKRNLTGVTIAVIAIFLLILGILRRSIKAEAKAKQAAAELQISQEKLQEALVQAEHANAAKTTFLSNMSHDIRTPMNAIVGITGLMSREPGLSDRLHNYIYKVQLSSQHLLSLINDVLDMSKIESGEVSLNREPVSFAEIIGQIDSIIRSQTNELGQSFLLRVHKVAHEYIMSDGLRLRQLLINLLSNATKYTPHGGSITFDLMECPCDKEGYAAYRIIVEDTGYGMAPEFITHLFEPFAREENSRTSQVQGTGLGMAIAKNIVDMMGGTIRVESEIGKGTRFEVDLAFEIDYNADMKTDLGSALLITDDEVLRENMAASMREANVHFYTAATRAEAADLMKQQNMDIVLIGGHLADEELADKVALIRSAAKDAILIFFVDYVRADQIEEVVSACRADGLIPRPFFLSNLLRTIERIRSADTCVDKRKSSLQGKRFLCAEDNQLNAEILTAVLEDKGASCKICRNGQEIVDAFASVQPGEYDAILMDVQMPRMNGLEATKIIRSGENPLGKTIPIIAMTANAFTEDIQDCLNAGMNAHIAKPIDIHLLEREINRLVTPSRFHEA